MLRRHDACDVNSCALLRRHAAVCPTTTGTGSIFPRFFPLASLLEFFLDQSDSFRLAVVVLRILVILASRCVARNPCALTPLLAYCSLRCSFLLLFLLLLLLLARLGDSAQIAASLNVRRNEPRPRWPPPPQVFGAAVQRGWANANDKVTDRDWNPRECNREARFQNVLTMTGQSEATFWLRTQA